MQSDLTRHIIETLDGMDLGYDRTKAFLGQEGQKGARWQEASVLMLISRDRHCAVPSGEEGRTKAPPGTEGCCFVLNKRSETVPQPGDLCFPGGHPSFLADRVISRVILPYLLPQRKQEAYVLARRRDPVTFSAIAKFLSLSLRECWEEMRVSPAHLLFLGALPCYRMQTRNRIIYPMAALLLPEARPRTGREIARNVHLSFARAFDDSAYGTYTLALTGKFRKVWGVDSVDMPCLLVKEEEGPDEVLWGATYNILTRFLYSVFGYKPPDKGPVHVSADLYPGQA
ncbi:MAG: hypothetical protein AB1921_13250 [Thermodesulfobacteriota bacterium]